LAEFNALLDADTASTTNAAALWIRGLAEEPWADDDSLAVGVVAAEADPRSLIPLTEVDAWLLAQEGSLLDALPRDVMTFGSVGDGVLQAGPSPSIQLPLLGRSARFRRASLSTVLSESRSFPSAPPASLRGSFVTFETLDGTDSGAHGLCGAVVARDLADVPVPGILAVGGTFACGAACPASRRYAACGEDGVVDEDCNSMLDLIVGGCALDGACGLALIRPTQPDLGTGGAPPVTLTADSETGKVDGDEAGLDDAFTTYLTISATRAHLTNNFDP